jgi:hypothetical protein
MTVRICSGTLPALHPVAAESLLRRKIVKSVKATTQIRLGVGPTMPGILLPRPLLVFMIWSALSWHFSSFHFIYHPTTLRKKDCIITTSGDQRERKNMIFEKGNMY